MKKLILILLIPITMRSQITFEKIDDKTLHVYAGMFSAYLFGGFIYYKTENTWLSVSSGALFTGTLAVAKEVIYDLKMKRGVCSIQDAVATFWGAAVGSVCLRISIDLKQKHDIEKAYFQNLQDSLFIEKLIDFKD